MPTSTGGAQERDRVPTVGLDGVIRRAHRALLRSRERGALLAAVCAALVEDGVLAAAWIAWGDPPAGGTADGTAAAAVVAHAGLAEVPAEATAAGWRAALRARGLPASAEVALREDGAVRGALVVHAPRGAPLAAHEDELLAELADDIAYTLDALARAADRARARAAAEDERRFSEAMIESMPGVVYFYDHTGRFLRWNHNFERVSGYTGAEIARMHPLDFFTGDERALVEARIADVLAHGEARVEAHFVAKDGTRTPYDFTGRRVRWGSQDCLVGMGVDVSAKANARRAIDRILESVTDAFVALDRDWRYTYVNERAARIFGRRREDLIGKHIWTEFPEGVGQPFHLAYERAMREGVELQLEGYYPPLDAWFENRIYPSADGLSIVFQNVSARKRAEIALRDANATLERRVHERTAALEETSRFLDAIIDHLPDPVFYKDADLRFLGANRAYEHAFGVDRAALVGRTVLDLGYLPDEDRHRYQDEQRALLATGVTVRREAAMPFADGREHQTLYSVTGITRADGSSAGVVGSIVDITALKEAEAALARAMRAAEAADRLKSAFLATMSHELRTPLNSIIGFTGILLQGLAGPVNDEQRTQLGMVRGSARHLLELINDVLDISKIEAGQMTVRREPVDLRAVLDKVIGVIRPLAEGKALALRLEAPAALPPLTSDGRRLEQILLNLLNNAVKFTERGAVTLAVELAAPDVLRLRVIDTGEGIAADDLPRLFVPFTQVDTGLTRRHEGTGLGLAICKRLTGLLGGDITCASTLGEGSTFTVVLPLTPRPS